MRVCLVLQHTAVCGNLVKASYSIHNFCTDCYAGCLQGRRQSPGVVVCVVGCGHAPRQVRLTSYTLSVVLLQSVVVGCGLLCSRHPHLISARCTSALD